MEKKRILFLANHFITLYSFRKELINEMLQQGHELYLSLPKSEENKYFDDLIISEYKRFWNLDFFIKRGNIEFETYGRIHNLKQSKELDKTIKETYDSYGLSYIEVESRDAVDKIIPIVLKEINQ